MRDNFINEEGQISEEEFLNIAINSRINQLESCLIDCINAMADVSEEYEIVQPFLDVVKKHATIINDVMDNAKA